MDKITPMGISSYYHSLPHGKKDEFVREVSDALGQSTQSVRRKIRFGAWKEKTELPIIVQLMEGRS